MPLLYHAYVYLEFLILACTIYILAPNNRRIKASDQLKWVGLMNNTWSAAEEIVVKEIVYI